MTRGGGGRRNDPPCRNNDAFMSTELLTNEAAVASRLGVSRDDLRELRKKEKGAGGLEEGVHWQRGDNKAVLYTQAGIAEAMRIIAESLPTQEEIEEAFKAPVRVRLHVARIVSNKSIVLAVRTAEEVRSPKGLLRVQVKNSKKMRPGMILDVCRHLNADLYAFEGRKARRPNTPAPESGQHQQPQQ